MANEDINLGTIWKEVAEITGNMSNEARAVHGLTYKEPEFKEVTDLCNKVQDLLGDVSLAIAELGELYRTVPIAHRR